MESPFWVPAVDPEVAEITSTAARVFEELGCSVDESDLAFDVPFKTWWALALASQQINHSQLLETHSDELTWYMREVLEAARDLSLED